MRNSTFKKWVVLLVMTAMAMMSNVAMAADNTATGDIAGISADLTDSNTFTLNSQVLALIKRAFDASGNAIASNSTLPRGTTVKFMIYVNNNTAVPVNDISMQDVLDPTFAYQSNTIKVATPAACALATCTALEEAAMFAAADATGALTDTVDLADGASYDGTDTINAGDATVANAQVDVAASTAWVMVFTVVMQ